MLTELEERNLLKMVTEIYHHLGLDGQRPISFVNIKEEVEKNISKWKDKKRIRDYVREESS